MKSPNLAINGFLRRGNQIPKPNQPVDEFADIAGFDPMQIITRLREIRPVLIIAKGEKPPDKIKYKGCTVMKESDVSQELEILVGEGLRYMRTHNYSECLLKLKRADMLISTSIVSTGNVSWKQITVIKINLGICFYKIGFLEDALSCFEVAASSLRRKKSQSNDICSLTAKRLVIQCLLQCCILLSEMGKHHEAVDLGKKVLRKSLQLFIKMFEITYTQKTKNEKSEENDGALLLLQYLVTKFDCLTHPILKQQNIRKMVYYYQEVKGMIPDHQLDIAALCKYIDYEWVEKANILSFLQVKPTFFEDLNTTNQDECGIDRIFYKLGLLSVAYYCVSTEYRFLEKTRKYEAESEHYLSLALEISYLFLPHEMPIVSQIISVHTKFHGLSRQVIAEDRDGTQKPLVTDDLELTVLKPTKKQYKGNFFVPLIRKCKQNQGYFSQTTQTEPQSEKAQQTPNQQSQRVQTSVNRKKPKQIGLKFQFQELLNESITRTKSAGRKTNTQQIWTENNLQNVQIKNLQEIYSNKVGKKRVPEPLGSKTMQIQTPLSGFHGLEELFRKPISVTTTTSRNQSPQHNFFSPQHQPQIQHQEHQFFERAKFDIQINNNISILINNERKKPQIRAKQLETLQNDSLHNNSHIIQGQQGQKIILQRGFITKKRSVSHKQNQPNPLDSQ